MKLGVLFSSQSDRLFSVGDLIDRGPESSRCLRFLQQPYTFAVLGNHEANLLELYEHDLAPSEDVLEWYARTFDVKWWLGVAEDVRLEILAELRKLPLVIEVETPRGLIGLVHGDVLVGMTWQQFTQAIEAGDKQVEMTALEGRDRIQSKSPKVVEGVGRVYVGHTVQYGGPQRFGNVYAMDTGAIFNAMDGDERLGLTMANLVFKTESLSQLREAGPSSCMKIEADSSCESLPFSNHSEAPRG